MPNVVDSDFQGSWPISPGRIQAAQSMTNNAVLMGVERPSKIIGRCIFVENLSALRSAVAGGEPETGIRPPQTVARRETRQCIRGRAPWDVGIGSLQLARWIDQYLRSAGAGFVVQYYPAEDGLRVTSAESKKGSRSCLFCKCIRLLGFAGCLAFWGWHRRHNSGFFRRARVTLLEFVDTTGRIHDLVFAGVKRM